MKIYRGEIPPGSAEELLKSCGVGTTRRTWLAAVANGWTAEQVETVCNQFLETRVEVEGGHDLFAWDAGLLRHHITAFDPGVPITHPRN